MHSSTVCGSKCVTIVVFVVRIIYIALVDLLYIPAGICVVARRTTVVVMGICKCLIGFDYVSRVLRGRLCLHRCVRLSGLSSRCDSAGKTCDG